MEVGAREGEADVELDVEDADGADDV